jgi:uncharacterized repeat protein (TIGR03803 family)
MVTHSAVMGIIAYVCGEMKGIVNIVAVCLMMAANCMGQVTLLHNFTGQPDGKYPNGDLISDGTFLYGTTALGGMYQIGTLFKIKPDGSGYVKLLDFTGTANGSTPFSSLISDGTFFYGVTLAGGASNLGTIFKIKPDGTSYLKLLDFTGAANGSSPYGSLFYDGAFLYGTTRQGGINDSGTVFKIMPDGSGYVKLLDFAGGTDGKWPYSSLVSDGTFLYGMTNYGGTSDNGILFKIMPDGSGYIKLMDFAGATNGRYPRGALIYDGTFFYGMTLGGGTSNLGTIFKIKPDGTGYLKLLDFAGTANGSSSTGALFYDGTFLYGMTAGGGAFNWGTAFKIKPDGSSYVKLVDFLGYNNGGNPAGSFISDGTFLYGMTAQGGTDNYGIIFKLDLATGINELSSANSSFSVSPIPSSGLFYLHSKEPITKTEVFNYTGQKVFTAQSEKTAIDLTKAAAGIYFYSVTLKDGTVAKGKMMKE